ncbi:unnamed protein product, partial [Didymodactylos carnosus]
MFLLEHWAMRQQEHLEKLNLVIPWNNPYNNPTTVYSGGVYSLIVPTIFLFYTVETDNGRHLSLSNNHYILVHQHGYLSGDQLTLNHSLYVGNPNGSMSISSIVKIKREIKYGVYQPVTLTGTLLVNGIAASSYLNDLKLTHEQLHEILAPLRWWYHLTRLLGDFIHQSTRNKLAVHWLQKRLIWYRDYLPFVYRT